ncbi:MAG: MFS transporter [Marinifilaceae bacterium]
MGFKQNITALYLIKIAKWFSLTMPIIVLFYEQNGLTLQEIFVLKSIYSIVLVMLDIPTGFLADAWGRKRCLVTGAIVSFGGFLFYAFSGDLWAFILAEIFLGIGQSLISGADSALLYDSTLHYNRPKDYLKYEGRVTMVGNFAEATAGILSGFLAAYSLRLPFYCQAGVAFIGIPAAMMIKDHYECHKIENPIRNILSIVRYSLVSNRKLCCNIMFSAIIGCATLTMAWFVQPIFIDIALPTEMYGVVWTGLNFTVGVAALFSDTLNDRWGEWKTFSVILFSVVALYVGTSFFMTLPWVFVILFLFYIIRGIATPILKGYINNETHSEMRATVLSIRNVVIRSFFAAMAPFIGWLCDAMSLAWALRFTALLVFIPGIIFLLLLKNKRL